MRKRPPAPSLPSNLGLQGPDCWLLSAFYMFFIHFLKMFLLIWWWWGVPDWQHWKLKSFVCPQNRYHRSSRTAGSPVNMPWGPLSKHLTQARKITFSSGLTGEKAIQISNWFSTLMLRLIKNWAGAHPDHSVTGVRDISILLVHFWSLLSLARETMVSRLSPA